MTEATQQRMTWHERTVCRILLIIAKMLAPSSISDDIKNLSSHISVHGSKCDD